MNFSKKFDRSISLITWGYNEELILEEFLNRSFNLLDEVSDDYELIFVNDGSTDETSNILKNYNYKQPRLKIITNDVNLNVGKSSRKAIEAASKDFIFWQTVDWSYDLNDLRIFLELTKYFDVVQGIRPIPIRVLSFIPIIRSIYRVRKRSDTFYKAIISLGNYYLLRILFGVPFYDFQNVTIYPAKILKSVKLLGDSSFINPECLLRTYALGITYIEVPIPFIPRKFGIAKGTKLKSILKSIYDIFSAFFVWGWQYRLDRFREKKKRIFRVSEPFSLDETIIHITSSLFHHYDGNNN